MKHSVREEFLSSEQLCRRLASATLIDVRSEIEFSKGSIPGAVLAPILTTYEREQVGICYAREGQKAAIELGHRMVSGDIREQRVQAWIELIRSASEPVVYCWRGGMRSEIAARWLQESGHSVPRLRGGYKAFRSYALSTLENLPVHNRCIVIGGATGVGKSQLLSNLRQRGLQVLDLEGLAGHRGSAFGDLFTSQPTVQSWENSLAIRLSSFSNQQSVFIEDESRLIGRLCIPPGLYQEMEKSPVFVIEETLENRTKRIVTEYIDPLLKRHGLSAQELLLERLTRIKKKLGGLRYHELSEMLSDLFSVTDWQHLENHDPWVSRLLQEYYDPQYAYHLDRSKLRVVWRGSRSEFLALDELETLCYTVKHPG